MGDMTTIQPQDLLNAEPQTIHEAVLAHLHEPRWAEASRQAIARLSSAEATRLLEAILNANSWGEDVLHRDLFFVAEVLEEGVAVDRAIAEHIVNELCDGLMATHGRDTLHRDYADSLGRVVRGVHGAFVTTRLREMHEKFLELGCKDWIEPLVIRHEPQTVQLLLDLSRPANGERMRLDAAEALGQLGERSAAITALLELVHTSNRDEIRMAAVSILAQWSEGAETIIGSLFDLMQTTESKYLRKEVMRAWAKLADRSQAVLWLLEIAHKAQAESAPDIAEETFWIIEILEQLNDHSPAVIDGLMALADAEHYHALMHVKVADALIKLSKPEQAAQVLLTISRSTPQSRQETIGAHLQKHFGPVMPTVSSEDHKKFVEHLTATLGVTVEQLGSHLMIGALIGDVAQATGEASIRLTTAQMLAQAGNAMSAIQLMSESVQDVYDSYKRLASEVSSHPEIPKASAQIELARAENFLLKAVVMLGQLGEPAQASQILLELLNTVSVLRQRLRLAEALGQIGKQAQAIQLLLDLISVTEDQWIKYEIAAALGRLGEKLQAKPILLELARTASDDDLRQHVAKTLGELGEKQEATQFLLELSRAANDDTVRYEAVKTLGELGNPSQTVLDILLKVALHDTDADIRDTAYGALKQLLAREESTD
jgi:tetratricopeptide (TPR) repeat protein